jgi:metal-responsive CopG/Arc/MetJ family transcriptional regulator
MTNINLPLPEELLEAVDRARGDVPRVVWIRRAIEQRLEKETVGCS